MIKILELRIPIRIISEANTFSHWTKRKKRKDFQHIQVNLHWNSSENSYLVKIPCHVKLTRIAPRKLNFDNLTSAFKFIRDRIADLIKPGHAPGRADDNDDITFEYAQEKGYPKKYAVLIEIFNHE